jgi:dCTP deaminase
MSVSKPQGALPYQIIRELIASGSVRGVTQDAALQPASLDLSLTDQVYRMRGSYLPRKGEPIEEIIKRGCLFTHDIEKPLEHNGIYLIKLAESLNLPAAIHAATSNKSSSGRINLRARLIADGVPRFDDIPAGYSGALWLEVSPKSFPVRVHAGDRINQMRFYEGDARLSMNEHKTVFDQYHLLRALDGSIIPASEDNVGRGITMTVDLHSQARIGWRAKTAPEAVLDTAVFDHDPQAFFEEIERPHQEELILHPGDFYILSTRERILTPPDFSTEMVSYDASKGEFRSHFAGFFDPGWGWRERDEDRGTIAVLEVECYGHPFVLRDGQPICLMVYERMLAVPEKLYGSDLKSNYAVQQGPTLAKWFKK